MRTIQDFLAYFRRQRSWTRTLVAAVPEEHFHWRPAADAFSCGELVRHLIQSEVFWRRMLLEGAEGRSFDPFGLTGTGLERMTAFRRRNLASSGGDKYGTSFAGLLETWSGIQAQTEEHLSRISPEQLASAELEHPLLTMRAPLWEMLLTMVGHEVHHRGQLSAYLKAIGAEQPASLHRSPEPLSEPIS
ncbi:MAG TPA: DinB family protein [Thermoanaerobaculia bacterium]